MGFSSRRTEYRGVNLKKLRDSTAYKQYLKNVLIEEYITQLSYVCILDTKEEEIPKNNNYFGEMIIKDKYSIEHLNITTKTPDYIATKVNLIYHLLTNNSNLEWGCEIKETYDKIKENPTIFKYNPESLKKDILDPLMNVYFPEQNETSQSIIKNKLAEEIGINL